jgi:hypothetical protein
VSLDLDAVRKVADAVLYEGYILYPYRASSPKNQSRWQFGVLMPPAYAAADPSESTRAQAECVFEHTGQPSVDVIVRFLQVQRRTTPGTPAWDEAAEHEIPVSASAAVLLSGGCTEDFAVPGSESRDGDVLRRRSPLAGTVTVRATPLDGPWQAARLTVQVTNRSETGPAAGPGPGSTAPGSALPGSALPGSTVPGSTVPGSTVPGSTVPGSTVPGSTVPGSTVPGSRDDALPFALVAMHMIITVSGGAFLSMTDAPEWAQPAVDACQNTGCWPVLAGPPSGPGSRAAILATPIILADHPELAPESAGDLYDGTEIDEILTLRTLALSDAEKAEARATDPRAAALLDRVESMDAEAMGRLHGTIRSPRDIAHESDVPWWDPAADSSVSPGTDSVLIGGQRIARGSHVTLRPGVRRADAQDMFLAGRAAIVEAVLLDVDDNPYLAVRLADDPDADLHIAHGRFLYFMPDEVEP